MKKIILSTKVMTTEQLFKLLNYTPKEQVTKSQDFEVIETVYGLIISEVEKSLVGENVVYVVLKNTDFTELRGPMVYHKIFKTLNGAVEYIFSQRGILGTEQRLGTHPGVDVNGKPYCLTFFNGFGIVVDILRP